MWRFHRYYIKEFLINLLLTFVMLFGIAVLATVSRATGRAQGLGLLLTLRLTMYWSMSLIPQLLSISVLVASVFTFGRAASDNEITAMRAAGIRPIRLLGAVLFVGALVGSANAWLLHEVIPWTHYEKYRPTKDAFKLLMINNKSRQNQWELDNFQMRWGKGDGAGRYLDVDFNVTNDRGSQTGRADSLEIVYDEPEDALILLIDGFDGEITRNGKTVPVKLPGQTTLAFSIGLLETRNRRDEGMHDVSTSQLVAEVDSGVTGRDWQARWLVGDRIGNALSTLFFALIGFPIGVLFRRSGRMVSFAISFVPLAFFYGLVFLGQGLSRRTEDWQYSLLPVAGLAIAAVLLTRRVFRQ
ncbi:MAG: LptF/LptG family permease [Planctomycetes bacterium]|nr:LptF/LptG family permease [Planctomycetota bacterium]